MSSDDQPTCGKGIAANAVIPAKLAELMAALSDVLDQHTKALDAADPAAQPELDAYNSLVSAHRRIASELTQLAQQMAGYADLPMPEHDMEVMTDLEGQAAAFVRFVAIERELLALLQTKLESDEQLLE